MGLSAVSLLVLGATSALPAVAVATFSLGFLGDLARPAVYATVADVVPPAARARAYGLLSWAINLGFAISPIVAGVASARSFTLLFWADAATTLACAGIIWRFVPESRPPNAGPPSWDGYLAPYRDRVFAPFVGLIFITTLLFYQCTMALPLDMRAHGIGAQAYGVLIALNGAIIVVLQPVATRALERFARPHVLAAGALLTGLGMGLTALAHSAGGYAGCIALWTLGEIALAPVGSAVVADLAPLTLRGSYQGAYHLAWGAASFLAPLCGSVVLQAWGARPLWWGCMALGCIAAAGHLQITAPRLRHLDLAASRPAS
jgi:MFS family permease